MAYHVDIQTGFTNKTDFMQGLHDWLISTLGYTQDSYTDGDNWVVHNTTADGRPLYVKCLPYNFGSNRIQVAPAIDTDNVTLLNAVSSTYWPVPAAPYNGVFAGDDANPCAFVVGPLDSGYWKTSFSGYYDSYLGANGFTTLSTAALSTDTVLSVVDASIFAVNDWVNVTSINAADKSGANLPVALVEVTAVDTVANTITVSAAVGSAFSIGSLVGLNALPMGLMQPGVKWGDTGGAQFNMPTSINGNTNNPYVYVDCYPYYASSWYDSLVGAAPVASLLPSIMYNQYSSGQVGIYGQLPSWLRNIHRPWADQSDINATDPANPLTRQTWKFLLCSAGGGIALRTT